MAIVMEVADDRHVASGVGGAADDLRNRRRRFVVVDGYANELRARARQGDYLGSSSHRVACLRIRHRLNDDGIYAANRNVAHPGGGSLPASIESHWGGLQTAAHDFKR